MVHTFLSSMTIMLPDLQYRPLLFLILRVDSINNNNNNNNNNQSSLTTLSSGGTYSADCQGDFAPSYRWHSPDGHWVWPKGLLPLAAPLTQVPAHGSKEGALTRIRCDDMLPFTSRAQQCCENCPVFQAHIMTKP